MSKQRKRIAVVAAISAAALSSVAVVSARTTGDAHGGHPHGVKHVLLISIDGLHQSDLAWYVEHHPDSAFALLADTGVEFSNAETPVPSDSFPGLIGMVTGGDPGVTGVYYDDEYNSQLLAPGTTDCATATPGTAVNFDETLDKDLHRIDAGQGLSGLPGSILAMTSNPDTVINPAALPVDPASCTPIYPHQYLQVNTIFDVARNAGLRTAWSDKHPAYEIVNGPSGYGVQDFFTPEINSDAPNVGDSNDWTTDNALTMQYDSYKVTAVLNWIRGFDHSGITRVGAPAIFGMNFQTVSTAEKLPVSDGLTGGYEADGVTPGPLLRRALDYVNAKLQLFLNAIQENGLAGDTVIILTAKHGQSPQKPSLLLRIDDTPILNALDAAWHSAYPTAAQPLVAAASDDDGMILWLNDRSDTATSFAKQFLLSYSGTGNNINGQPVAFSHSGPVTIFAGAGAAHYFGTQVGDPRVPDVFGISQVGVVFTGGMGKIAEHGGANPDDRDVPLIVAGEPITHHGIDSRSVETTQIAPTILELLGLGPDRLQAVAIEGTRPLDLR